MSYPAQDLVCPDPAGCPVLDSLPRLRTYQLPAETPMFRVYDSTWGYDEHNPGYGDARFSPFDDPADGRRVPSMYLAATATAALLETIFHEVHHRGSRTIFERDLRHHLLAHLRVPTPARLGDLRDVELARHQIDRDQVVSSPAEHYPCTRRLAVAAYAASRSRPFAGLIWNSRQAELAEGSTTEVVVLFGTRYPSGRGTWTRTGPGSSNLVEGPGRLLVESIAEELDATIEPDG